MSHAPAASKEQLMNDFTNVVTEAENLLKTVADLGNDKAGALKGDVGQALASAGARLAEIRDRSVAQATAAANAADAYVQESPWRAMGWVALGSGVVGLVAGLLIARR